MPELQPIIQRISTKYEPAGIDGFLKGLGNIKSLAPIAAAGIGLVVSILGKCADAGAVNETALYHLNATLESTGRSAEISSQAIGKVANSLMGMSAFDDEAIIDAYTAIAKFETIDTASMDDVIKSAMDMSAALGGDLAANANDIARILETGVVPRSWGFSKALKENILDMVNAGDSAGALDIVLAQLGTRFGGQAAAEMGTYAGKMKALNIAISEIQESIGAKLIPILKDAADAALLALTWQEKLDSALADHGEEVGKATATYKEYFDEMQRAYLITQGGTEASRKAWAAKAQELYTIESLAKQYGIWNEAQWRISRANEALLGMPDYGERAASGMRELTDAVDAAAAAQRDYASDLSTALSAAQEMGDFLDTLKSLEGELASTPIWDVKGIADLKNRIAELKETHRLAVLEMIAGMYQVSLAADGVFDEADMQELLDYRLSVGLLSEAEYDAAQNAISLAAAIAALKDKNITVTTTMITIMAGQIEGMQSKTSQYGTTTKKAAAGGQLGSGWTMVGEEGYELIGPDGMVYSHKKSIEMMSKGLRNVQGFATGSEAPPPPKPFGIGSGDTGYKFGTPPMPGKPKGGGSRGSGSSSDQWGGSSSDSAATGAAQEASSAAKQTSQSAQSMAQSARQTTRAQQETQVTNNEMLAVMKSIDEKLDRNNTTIISEFKKFIQ
jgi:hypothetical protein